MIDDQAWCQSSGTHYRELAAWLREIGGKCRLPNPQRELLSLARRYELRADHLDRRSRQGRAKIVAAARLGLAWLSNSAIAADLSGPPASSMATPSLSETCTSGFGALMRRSGSRPVRARRAMSTSAAGTQRRCSANSPEIVASNARREIMTNTAAWSPSAAPKVARSTRRWCDAAGPSISRSIATGDTGPRKTRPTANNSGSGPAGSRCRGSGGIGISAGGVLLLRGIGELAFA